MRRSATILIFQKLHNNTLQTRLVGLVGHTFTACDELYRHRDLHDMEALQCEEGRAPENDPVYTHTDVDTTNCWHFLGWKVVNQQYAGIHIVYSFHSTIAEASCRIRHGSGLIPWGPQSNTKKFNYIFNLYFEVIVLVLY